MQISDMIPGVNIISRKVSVASVNEARGSEGCSETSVGVLRGGGQRYSNNIRDQKIQQKASGPGEGTASVT